jgi:hypothetical protein
MSCRGADTQCACRSQERPNPLRARYRLAQTLAIRVGILSATINISSAPRRARHDVTEIEFPEHHESRRRSHATDMQAVCVSSQCGVFVRRITPERTRIAVVEDRAVQREGASVAIDSSFGERSCYPNPYARDIDNLHSHERLPVIGPWVQVGYVSESRSAAALYAVPGIVQLGGLALLIAGAVVRNRALAKLPSVGTYSLPGGGGLTVGGRF